MTEENQEVILDNTEDQIIAEEAIEEATTAAATLKPSASKSEMLSKVMKHYAGMTKQDLSAFLTKTLDQVGKEADSGLATSAKNMGDIKMNSVPAPAPGSGATKAMKEDVQDLFDGEELSEEFQTKTATLFEAAVSNRVQIEVARIEEEYETKLEEQVSASIDELHEQINTYMNYVVEKWMEDNEVAIQNNYRVEATENFIEGLKELFTENYVEVPDEKIDMIGEMEKAISELEEQVEAATAENVRLTNEINENKVVSAFEEITEGLVDTQVEKLRSLSENVEYSSIDEYKQKLEIIKKQYFSESREETSTGLIIEEETIGSNDDLSEEKVVPVEMRNYVQAISKTIKR